MNETIYLDYAASTPVDPAVLEAMLPYFSTQGFGNPTSMHRFGSIAKKAVDEAREKISAVLHADTNEIIFTSGATEANNLALQGAARIYHQKGRHIITLKTEHASVLDCCQYLEKQGFAVTYLSPLPDGCLDMAMLEAALRPDTILVSMMHVQNEIGTIQNIAEIAAFTAAKGIILHVDAVQSVGKIAMNLKQLPIDLMTFSGHKLYAPKGIGGLFIRNKPRIKLAPLIYGGGQERGMRSGTLPTQQIVGLGEAIYIAERKLTENWLHVEKLRQIFLKNISTLKYHIHSPTKQYYPGILNISFPGYKNHFLIDHLPALAFSIGSACHAKGTEPSHVLRALGLSQAEAECAIRLSWGRFTKASDIETAANVLTQLLSR